ncbi:MAG: TetR/AcrR family transcriptional regulator [Erysipelotrichaceae bacterium]|nr:TetR/AcrR family transcriptional regulator [Erysipelotrichaceae bacterium]
MQKINKEEISNIALELFSSKGYNNVTINDICDACEITKPTFYKYAGSKDELILNLYDRTIHDITTDTYRFLQANSHYEQLVMIFSSLIQDTMKFGPDLFSQMMITNLNENHHSFDMRENLTELAIMIIEKAQDANEINNMNDPKILYSSLAYTFSGYEITWCMYNGETNFIDDFFTSMNAILDVKEELRDIYKKYLEV